MQQIRRIGQAAKAASVVLRSCGSRIKNKALAEMGQSIMDFKTSILEANAMDIEAGKKKGLSSALIDRLSLTVDRIEDMAGGLKVLQDLPDPIGEVVSMWKRPSGLRIGQVRVPLGVVGIIYEARPNVTVDAAALALKAGNAVILKGGSEAINSNKAIVQALHKAVESTGLPQGSIGIIENTSRDATTAFMKMNDYLDVLIPRGGPGLIEAVIQNASVPVIQTGQGNCHIFVDSSAELAMAKEIVINAKCQRPGVCNACETLLVDKKVSKSFVPEVVMALQSEGVEVRGCPQTKKLCDSISVADEDDWGTEYLDYIIAVKVVAGIGEAIEHINFYGTGHSEAIVTNDYKNAQRFLDEIDAAAVYVNASTRYTDGFEFGFGAEMGISTQKLHARGPMGLKELTTIKYIIYGDGQVR